MRAGSRARCRLRHVCFRLLPRYDGAGMQAIGRQPLNLVVCLDISGSMSDPFNDEDHVGGTKLDAAKRSLSAIASKLKAGDSLGVVVFSHTSHALLPLRSWTAAVHREMSKKVMCMRVVMGEWRPW